MRYQSGIPAGLAAEDRNANGLLLRGAVIATYVSDDPTHPAATYPSSMPPVAVYCDVLVYASIAGMRWFGLKNVLVSQPGPSGIHRGRIWKPRATTLDIEQALAAGEGSNPAFFDGDHVLIGFLDNKFDQPIILGSLPHPSVDVGRATLPVGQRMKLKVADGDPDFFRHHGTHWGIDSNGNWVTDSRFANDGKIEDDGFEQEPPVDGKGKQEFILPADANFAVTLWDMSDPQSPVEKIRFQVDKTNLHFQIDGESITISGKDATATLVLGNGAVKAAIADHLETLYGQIKNAYALHKHPSGTGPTGFADTTFPDWDPTINSQKLTFPDG